MHIYWIKKIEIKDKDKLDNQVIRCFYVSLKSYKLERWHLGTTIDINSGKLIVKITKNNKKRTYMTRYKRRFYPRKNVYKRRKSNTNKQQTKVIPAHNHLLVLMPTQAPRPNIASSRAASEEETYPHRLKRGRWNERTESGHIWRVKMS